MARAWVPGTREVGRPGRAGSGDRHKWPPPCRAAWPEKLLAGWDQLAGSPPIYPQQPAVAIPIGLWGPTGRRWAGKTAGGRGRRHPTFTPTPRPAGPLQGSGRGLPSQALEGASCPAKGRPRRLRESGQTWVLQPSARAPGKFLCACRPGEGGAPARGAAGGLPAMPPCSTTTRPQTWPRRSGNLPGSSAGPALRATLPVPGQAWAGRPGDVEGDRPAGRRGQNRRFTGLGGKEAGLAAGGVLPGAGVVSIFPGALADGAFYRAQWRPSSPGENESCSLRGPGARASNRRGRIVDCGDGVSSTPKRVGCHQTAAACIRRPPSGQGNLIIGLAWGERAFMERLGWDRRSWPPKNKRRAGSEAPASGMDPKPLRILQPVTPRAGLAFDLPGGAPYIRRLALPGELGPRAPPRILLQRHHPAPFERLVTRAPDRWEHRQAKPGHFPSSSNASLR